VVSIWGMGEVTCLSTQLPKVISQSNKAAHWNSLVLLVMDLSVVNNVNFPDNFQGVLCCLKNI
jgi:hypothetical protein